MVVRQYVDPPEHVWTKRELVALIQTTGQEMDERYALIEASPVPDGSQFPILLGRAEVGGDACEWDPGRDAHLLLVGAAGSGKTALIRSVIVQWSCRGWGTWAVDSRPGDLLGNRAWPGVLRVAQRGEAIAEVIRAAHGEMERRLLAIEAGGDETFEPRLLILDEYHAIRARLQGWYIATRAGSDPVRCPELTMLADLLARAGMVGIHLVVSMLRPDGDLLADGGSTFRARVSLGRLSDPAAWMMWRASYEDVVVPDRSGVGMGLDPAGRPVVILPVWAQDPRRADSREDRQAAWAGGWR
jgi:hypothetical protein